MSVPYLDQRLKMAFLAMEKEGKDENLEQNIIRRTLEKKEKTNLKWFLSSIMLEKKGTIVQYQRVDLEKTHTEALMTEFHIYSQIKEISAVEYPLFCWKDHEKSLPILAYFAKRYMCIAASSCTSEHVFSTSNIFVSPRRIRLSMWTLLCSWPRS